MARPADPSTALPVARGSAGAGEVWAGWLIRWLPIPLLALAGLAAYANTFNVPFLFDDIPGIVDLPLVSSKDPVPWTDYLTWQTPVVVLTLRANFLIHGREVWGYHAVNLAIHILAALTLYGIAWRTLGTERLRGRFGRLARPLALAVAGLWMLHPVQTQAVTYLIQRKESLMGLFYLLTVYCFIRGMEARRRPAMAGRPWPRRAALAGWFAAAAGACALGMATKQVAATAPIVVLLYDLAFFPDGRQTARRDWALAGLVATGLMAACVAAVFVLALRAASMRTIYLTAGAGAALAGACLLYPLRGKDALRRRWPAHLALFATWGVLLCTSLQRLGGEGLGGTKMSTWDYAGSQPGVILHYLGLLFTPNRLCFDYGARRGLWPWAESLDQVLPHAAAVLALVVASLWLAIRRPAWGFWACWFFLILAPSSSLLVVQTAMAFDYRVYLPTAGLAMLAVMGLYSAWRLLPSSDGRPGGLGEAAPPLAMLAVLAGVLGWATFERNKAYQSELAIWDDTARKVPDNDRAVGNYGKALLDAGQLADAMTTLTRAIELNSTFAHAYHNRGEVFRLLAARTRDKAERLGLLHKALADAKRAIDLLANFSEAYSGRGRIYYELGDETGNQGYFRLAELTFRQAIATRVNFASAYFGLGAVLVKLEDYKGAIEQLKTAIRCDPNIAEAHLNLGDAYVELERFDEGLAEHDKAIALNSRMAEAWRHRGQAYIRVGAALRTGRHYEDARQAFRNAIADLDRAIELDNKDPLSYLSRGLARVADSRLEDGIEDFTRAIALRPDYALAYENRAATYKMIGEQDKAQADMQMVLQLRPPQPPTQ